MSNTHKDIHASGTWVTTYTANHRWNTITKHVKKDTEPEAREYVGETEFAESFSTFTAAQEHLTARIDEQIRDLEVEKQKIRALKEDDKLCHCAIRFKCTCFNKMMGVANHE